MVENKGQVIEREYIVPIREKTRVAPRYKKTPKAVKSVKEFVARHMKVYDRDLDKVRIDKFLNEFLWFKGIRSPPHKVKVRVVKEGEIVRVYLAEMSNRMQSKKLRLEKRDLRAKESETKKPKKVKEEKEEQKAENKEGEAEIVEAGEKESKKEHKKEKHKTINEDKVSQKQMRYVNKTGK